MTVFVLGIIHLQEGWRIIGTILLLTLLGKEYKETEIQRG